VSGGRGIAVAQRGSCSASTLLSPLFSGETGVLPMAAETGAPKPSASTDLPAENRRATPAWAGLLAEYHGVGDGLAGRAQCALVGGGPRPIVMITTFTL
jgi:hypothetical protein